MQAIAKRVSEAYSVLRDPRRRQAYDRRLDSGEGLRMQLAEAQAEAGRATQEQAGTTPQGRQYHRLAVKDMERSDWAAAARNLQTALTFEPGCSLFQKLLAEAKQQLR